MIFTIFRIFHEIPQLGVGNRRARQRGLHG